ncbi:MAG: hypothetical protein P1V35_17280 [Planctomycetota bacterium]|nr:hypothetical protein [Planctomycetota bacterium]
MPNFTPPHPDGESLESYRVWLRSAFRAGLSLTLLLCAFACMAPSVDWVARYRADFAQAQETGTVNAYRAFLRKRPPSNGNFDVEQATARRELKKLRLQEALAQDLGPQIRYVCEIQEPESRDQVFASVREKLEGKPRVECMQWLWPLGRCADGLQPADQAYLSEIL